MNTRTRPAGRPRSTRRGPSSARRRTSRGAPGGVGLIQLARLRRGPIGSGHKPSRRRRPGARRSGPSRRRARPRLPGIRSGGDAGVDRVGERLGGDRLEVAGDRLRQRVDPDLDPVVERELGFAAEVLDRPLELAGVALGAELRRQRGVDDDDQPLVVGDRRPGSRASPGSRPRRAPGSARPGRRCRPAGSSTSPARAAAMIAGIRSPYFRPILGRSGLTRRSTSSDSSPMSSTDLTLTSSAISPSSASRSAQLAAGQGEPQPGQRLADLEPGVAAERPGELDRPTGGRHRRLERLRPGARPARPSARRQVDAVRGIRGPAGDQVVVDRLAEERQDRAP